MTEWVTKRLGEVCEFYNGQAHENNIDENGKYILINSKFISSNGTSFKRTNEALFPLKKGDIVMVMSDVPNGKALAKCFLVDADNRYTMNQRICAIRTKNFDLKFLWYQLNRNKHFLEFNNGENQTNLRKNDILNCPLLAPSLDQQKRIVKILAEAFAAIDKAKANVEKNVKNAKELFESYLQNVFVNGDADWEVKRLDEITEVKDGTHDSPKYIKEGIPFVTQKNIREVGLTLEDTKFITQEDHNKFYKRSNVSFGDIIISMIGANRGMACIVDDKRTFSIKNVGLVKNNDAINQSYLLYYLKSPVAKEYVKQSSNGGAQEFVGLTALRAFPILVAPRKQQDYLVANLDKLKAETKRLENLFQQKLYALDELKKSILQKAFAGELTAEIQFGQSNIKHEVQLV